MTAPPALPEPALSFSFLGYALRLAEPGALKLLLAVLALAALGAVALARRRIALVRAAGALAPRVAPGANRTRPAARLSLSLLGLALFALALARPQCGTRTELARQHGVDLAVVLDASRSMLAADVKPHRLERAKLELASLLDDLGGDRVGIVVFAGDAFVQCPLTSDRAAAKLFLRAVDPEAFPRQGTALARALAAARELLLGRGAGGARAKVVLVVSDGEDHEGGVASAARSLAQEGVSISALAVGTADGAPVPPRAGARAADGRTEAVLTRLDVASLRLLADEGGGEVYDVASPDHGIAAFRAALDRMERSELEGRVTVTYEDRYALLAFPGFLLLLAALLVREARTPARVGPRSEVPRRSISTPTSTTVPLALLCLLLLGFSPFHAEERNVRAGNERLRAGDPAGALRAYDDAEREAGAHPEIDFDRGDAAYREGRLEEAKAAWGRAAGAAPAPLASRALQNLGSALAAAGDEDGAVRAFSDALAKDPSNEDARWNLEVLLRKGGKPPDASGSPPHPAAQGERDRAVRGDGAERGTRDERGGEARREPPQEADAKPDRARAAEQPGTQREVQGAGAERRDAGEGGPRKEPLSRQQAEALLDALRARERKMPLFGGERAKARRQDAAKDW